MTADGVTSEDFIFASVRQMEYLVRIKLAACQKAAGRKLEGHIVISVSTCGSGVLSCALCLPYKRADRYAVSALLDLACVPHAL